MKNISLIILTFFTLNAYSQQFVIGPCGALSEEQIRMFEVGALDTTLALPITQEDNLYKAIARLQNAVTGLNSTSNEQYEIVAGTFRQTGGIWSVIDNAGHEPMGITFIEQVGKSIRVNFEKNYSKVISLIVVADETLTKNGVIYGSSVSTDHCRIDGYAPISSRRINSGAAFSVVTQIGGGVTAATWNAATNSCRLTLENAFTKVNGYAVSPISRSAKYRCIIGETSTTWVDIQFVDKDGNIATAYDPNQMAFDVTIGRPYQIDMWNNTINTSLSNIWLFGIMKL